MKRYISIVAFFFIQLNFSQTVDFNIIKFKGLSFYSLKSEIVEKMGKPKKIFKPNYECGFLSNDEREPTYFTLDYGKIKFTGSKTEKYVLEKINFENNSSIILYYGKHKLSCKTTFNELVEIFGKGIIKLLKESSNRRFTIMHLNNDDGMIIEIKNGKLIGIEYWSPC